MTPRCRTPFHRALILAGAALGAWVAPVCAGAPAAPARPAAAASAAPARAAMPGEAWARAALFEYTAGRPDRAARLAGLALAAGSGSIPATALRFARTEALRQAGQPEAAERERDLLMRQFAGTPWARAVLDLCALEDAPCADALDPATAATRGPLGLVAAVAQGERIARSRGARAAEAWGKPLEATAAGPFWSLLLGHAHLAAGDTAAAQAALERAVERAAARGDGDLVSEAALRRAALAYYQGNAATALHWVERVGTDKSRTLSCPAAILTGYAHYRLGHAHEAAAAFNYAQACTRDRGERGRLLALEARCRAQSGEYRIAAAVAGDGAADLEAASRGEGVGVALLTDATDVLEGALELDVDRPRLAREFFLAQAAREGWMPPMPDAPNQAAFPFRLVRTGAGEAARAENKASGREQATREIESPASRSARLDAYAADDRVADRAGLVAAVTRDLAAMSDSLRNATLSPADSAAWVSGARRRAGALGEAAARATEQQGRATAARARARAGRARALAALTAPAPERREEPFEAIDRAALVREAAGLEALADSAEARAARDAAAWRGARSIALNAGAAAGLARRQAEARRLAADARGAAADAGRDAPLADLAERASAADRAAVEVTSADSLARLAAVRDDDARARAHTAQMAERARADYEVALFERGAWSAIALDESDSTEADLRPAISACDDFLARFPQSQYVGATEFNRADLEVRLAYARARAHGGAPDFAPAVARYERLLTGTPPFARRDAVLFNLAALAREAGDPATSDRRLAELLATAPGTDLAREAHIELGDRALDGERWAEAEGHFGAVAAGGGPLASLARYKQGFAALKRGDAAAATEAFAGLLALPDLPPEIADDGLAQLAKALRQGGGASAADRFLSGHPNPPYAHALLVAMAEQDFDDGAFDAAARAWRLAMEREPTRPENLALAQKVLGAWDARSRPDERELTRVDLGHFFGPGGKGVGLGAEAQDVGARALLEAAFLAHEAGRTRKDMPALTRAVGLYRELARLYPQSDSLALAASSEGEALFDLGRFDESARAHERALAIPGAPADVKREAAFGAALARERVAAADGYRSAGVRDSLERAVTRLESESPGDARVPPLWLSLALGAKEHEDPARARRVFEHVAGRDTSEASRRAQAELGRVALAESRWLDAEKAYAEAAAGYLAAGDRAEETRLSDLAASARFKAAEDQAAGPDSARAASTFRTVADRYPNFARADVALYRAGLAALQGGQPRLADEHLATLRERYPASKLVDDALLKRGDAALAARDTLGAAQVLAGGRLAEGGTLGVEALEQAGRLFRAAGGYTDAEATYRRLIKQSPDGRARTRALADLATLQYELGRRAELAQTLAPWRVGGRLPDGFAPDAEADVRARFVLGRVLADSCLAIPIAHPIKPALDRKLAALGPALENLKAAARTVESPYWAESGYFAGLLLDDLGARLGALPPPSVMASADSAGYRAAIGAQARGFYTRAEDLWIATLEGLPASADTDSVARARRPQGGWRGRIWERLEPRLQQHLPWRLAATDLPGQDGSGGLVAGAEPHVGAVDSTALDAGALEDLRNRLRWISQYVADQQVDLAAQWCEAALKLYPTRAEIWNDLGVVRQLRGSWGEAERAWNKALELDPRQPGALMNRALFGRFYRLDRAAARRDFERFLTLGASFDETLADRMAEEKQP